MLRCRRLAIGLAVAVVGKRLLEKVGRSTVSSQKLEYGPRTISVGFPFFQATVWLLL